jgi:hypothetical protein
MVGKIFIILPNLFVCSPYPNLSQNMCSVDSCFMIVTFLFAYKRLPDFCLKSKNDFGYKQVHDCVNLSIL